METLIFNKNTKVLMGSSFNRRTEEATKEQLRLDIDSILGSEGGVNTTLDDYILVPVKSCIVIGCIPILKENNTIDWIPDPKNIYRKRINQSIRIKYRDLGFTEEEINELKLIG